MKKKITSLFTFAVMTIVAISFTNCGEEVSMNDDPKPEGKTEFYTESKKSIGDEGTRTSTDDDRYFYWTVGDNILVEQSTGNWIPSTTNTITTVQASAKFYFNEPLPNETYNVRYTGFGNTDATTVNIAPSQTQSAWKDGSHIATSGDCGIATATHQGDRKYKFTVAHKAAYIILYPYMVSSIPTHYSLNRTYTLMKVEVKSTGGAEIAGQYSFGTEGITGSATSNASDVITLNCGTNGFALENNSNPRRDYLVIVMRPIENNKLTFTYYVKDNTDGTVFTYSESPGIRTYSPNGFTVLTHTIPDMVYNMPTYYKWGTNTAYTPNGAYSTSVVAPYTFTNGAWAYAPNANRMYWYAQTAIVDVTRRWRIAGQSTVYTNGVWMKKLTVIASENGKTILETGTAGPDGKDWRTDANLRSIGNGDIYRTDNPNIGSPANGIVTQYFYLPCFGLYNYPAPSTLAGFGGTAYYWSSSAGYDHPSTGTYNSVRFAAGSSTVNINLQSRANGFVVGQGWFQ